MDKSPLQERVGRALGEAWLLDAGELVEEQPAELVDPEQPDHAHMIEQFLAYTAAGHRDLLTFSLSVPRRPGVIVIGANEVNALWRALQARYVDTTHYLPSVRVASRRGQAALGLGALGFEYHVNVRVSDNLHRTKPRVTHLYAQPLGMVTTRLGLAAMNCSSPPYSEALRASVRDLGLPDDPAALRELIGRWNADPLNQELPPLPLPAMLA